MQSTVLPRAPDWTQRARLLAGLTIGWNVIEGLLSMAFGLAEESVALFGFGLDSWVEVGSAAVTMVPFLMSVGMIKSF